MDFEGELLHLIVQTIRHVMKDLRPGAIGHVIDYDPTIHAIRVAAPGYPVVDSQGNLTGEFGQTGWMQLGTLEGHQTAPHVGDASTLTGDQYYLFIIERAEGTAIVVSKTYNDKELPPFQDLLPGEWGYKNRDSGSWMRFHKNGDSEHQIQGKITLKQVVKNLSVVLDPTSNSITINGPNGSTIAMQSDGTVLITPGEGGGGGKKVQIGGGGGQNAARHQDVVTLNQDGSGGIVGYVQVPSRNTTVN